MNYLSVLVSCHMMESVVNHFQDFGVEVIHTPVGCTGLSQPVNFERKQCYKNGINSRNVNNMVEKRIMSGVRILPTCLDTPVWFKWQKRTNSDCY